MTHFLSRITPYSLKRLLKILRFYFVPLHKAQSTSHLQKQAYIYSLQRKYEFNVFIETGTFLGEMVSVMRYFFSFIYSIELDPILSDNAKDQFKNNPQIQIIEGDSSVQLLQLLSKINESALFWLDGHYSGAQTAMGNKQCPVLEELDAIAHFKHKATSLILIDDARLFNGENDYPKISVIKDWAKSNLPNHLLEINMDIIALIPIQKGQP